ncbi:MAG: peptidase S41, partial [Desulfuromusa sp.]|nr:peptidase S41 [Desulfuromusa sp.]
MFMVKRLIQYSFFLLVLGSGVIAFSGTAFANEEDDYKNLEIFTDVLSLVRSSYVEDIDMDELIYGAIRGMLNTLD